MLGYRKITAEEDKMRNVFEKGEYSFLVESVEKKDCKNGINTMLVVNLLLMNEGKSLKITDWIMLDMENFEYKLRHFADSCGLIEKYDANTLEDKDFLGREGMAKVSVTEYEKDGELIKTNKINDYVKAKMPKVNDSDFLNDAIPF
jgi:hypothetical protein